MKKTIDRILFLDDNASRTSIFLQKYPYADTVETADACIERIQHHNYDIVFLDHDLGGQEWVNSDEANTGSEVVRWIIEFKPKIGRIVVHSWNTSEGPHMVEDLKRAGYSTIYQPFNT